MPISEHSDGLASTIEFSCNSKKQDKRLINHHFPLHIPQQTKHHFGDPRYASSKWYIINFQWIFGMQIIGGGGSTNLLGILNLPWQGFEEKNLQKCKHIKAW